VAKCTSATTRIGTDNHPANNARLWLSGDLHHALEKWLFLGLVSLAQTHHDFVEPVTYFMFHRRLGVR
jgi:hypothetical protein